MKGRIKAFLRESSKLAHNVNLFPSNLRELTKKTLKSYTFLSVTDLGLIEIFSIKNHTFLMLAFYEEMKA